MLRQTPLLRIAVGLVIAVLLGSSPAVAQTGAPQQAPTLQQQIQAAMGKVFRGDAEGGIEDLRTLTRENPESAGVWDALGRAHQAAQDHTSALEAFTRAVALAPANGQMQLNLGLSYAANGNVDAAFEALARADESGAVDITQIDAGSAAAVLRDDPRYAELMPTNEEYADPFVEEARILREWVGEGRGEVFGWIARNVGDVDGDGIDDVATSSKGVVGTGTRDGKVYVYSSGTGELLWSYKGTVSGGQLGFGIEAAGDVNADGIPDVVAGAPNAAYAMVFNGRTGDVLLELESDDPTSGFGMSVKGIGDLDGDGHSDILVGEPYQMWGAPLNGGTLNHP
ncbi:MAG: tetratricopeptide repeat protein, partial [Rhodothermales bacterium]|nr:tetratricopeptide repeat protein [Rhodothermales bacterium]